MKADKSALRQRLTELGLSSSSKIKLTKYRYGYTIKIRNATYAIDKSVIGVIRELLSESR